MSHALQPELPRLSELLPATPGVPSQAPGAAPRTGQYHAPVIVRRMALALVLLGTGGCLENLNQQKYFEKLEAGAPGLAVRVHRHRSRIEQQLHAQLSEEAPAPVAHIGMWGETWDLVRTVTDGERLFMRGRIFHEEGPASSYFLAFSVAEDGTVEVHAIGVYGRGAR